MRPCFAFASTSASDRNAAGLTVFGDIGFGGVQANEFMAALDAVTARTIDVEISSNGGDVFAALTMYNGLRASGKTIRTKVMGVAASAASLVFLAGDKREMPGNTFVMVHSAATLPDNFTAAGMREAVALLEKVDAVLHALYASRTGMKPAAVSEMMSKDSWMTADQAKALGFATLVTPDVKASASLSLGGAPLPAHIRAALARTPGQTPGVAHRAPGSVTTASIWDSHQRRAPSV